MLTSQQLEVQQLAEEQMAVVLGLERASSAAELETQNVELVLEVAPVVVLAPAASTRGYVAGAGLPPEFVHSSCAPWYSSLPRQSTDGTMGTELSVA